MKRIIAPMLFTFIGLLAGCGDKDVPFVIDSEEITRYVREDGVARELFRNSGLINPTPYTLPIDGATYYDSLISVRRTIEVFLVPLKILGPNGDSVNNDPDRIYVDHGYLGRVREGLAQVEDRFTVHITRVYSDTTKHDTTVIALTRYGFFLKLGADTRPYVGWVLWGFNGAGTRSPYVGISLHGSAGTSFRGDLALYPDEPLSSASSIPRVPYIRLAEIDTVVAGSRLLITTNKASDTLPTWQLISDYGEGGAFTRPLVRYNAIDFVDSLSYQTPTSNPRLYNLVMLQMLFGHSPLQRTCLVVPYRR